jgi:hypothetical protein
VAGPPDAVDLACDGEATDGGRRGAPERAAVGRAGLVAGVAAVVPHGLVLGDAVLEAEVVAVRVRAGREQRQRRRRQHRRHRGRGDREPGCRHRPCLFRRPRFPRSLDQPILTGSSPNCPASPIEELEARAARPYRPPAGTVLVRVTPGARRGSAWRVGLPNG